MPQNLSSSDNSVDESQKSIEQLIADGHHFLTRDQQQEAFEAFEKAIHLDPDKAEIRFEVGCLLEYYGFYEKHLFFMNRHFNLTPRMLVSVPERQTCSLSLNNMNKL